MTSFTIDFIRSVFVSGCSSHSTTEVNTQFIKTTWINKESPATRSCERLTFCVYHPETIKNHTKLKCVNTIKPTSYIVYIIKTRLTMLLTKNNNNIIVAFLLDVPRTFIERNLFAIILFK